MKHSVYMNVVDLIARTIFAVGVSAILFGCHHRSFLSGPRWLETQYSKWNTWPEAMSACLLALIVCGIYTKGPASITISLIGLGLWFGIRMVVPYIADW